MRLLVVEDEQRMATLLQRALSEDGHVVDVAHDGPDGLWLAMDNEYDVVVLDAMLPRIDGFEVCRRLRAAKRWTPVLMLTARGTVADRIQGLDAGADDYLLKPFALGELGARLRALARRGDVPRPAVLEVRDLRLDPAAHAVTAAGVAVALTAKEFALLEVLMRHPGQVLSRHRILDLVWGNDSETASNVVDQYVGYLRRKLARSSAVRTDIETVRGVGYRMRG